MIWVFWISAALIVYTYGGYTAVLWLRARLAPKQIVKRAYEPTVSIVMAVHNEASRISAKLANLADLNYPKEKLEVVIVSDGSTDHTNDLLKNAGVTTISWPENRGKAAALDAAMAAVTGDVVVFMDARQRVAQNAIELLVQNLADPSVGCVSASLHFDEENAPLQGEVVKMHAENRVRDLESKTGSTIGVLGALYAARRELLSGVPRGTILDDCYIPLSIVRQGYRCVFESEARAWDPINPTPGQEFNRKVRTIAGLYQLIRLMPWLLNPASPVFWRFLSHKVCRMLLPFMHAALLVSAALSPAPFYKLAFLGQVVLLGLGLLAPILPKGNLITRIAGVPLTITILNCAATVALFRFISGRRITWAGA